MEPDDVQALTRAGRKRPVFEPAPQNVVNIGRDGIEKLLQHRAPFLLLDAITAVDAGTLSIAGKRRIDPADPVFRGHFPKEPIYPGVLLLEIMGQLGLCLNGLLKDGQYAGLPEEEPRQARALKIHQAVFLDAVRPGDELTVLAKVIEGDDFTASCAGQIVRGDTICAFALMEVYFVES